MRVEEMSDMKKNRVQELFNAAAANMKIWRGVSRYVMLDYFAKKWGITRYTVIKDYVPVVVQMLKRHNASFQTALDDYEK